VTRMFGKLLCRGEERASGDQCRDAGNWNSAVIHYRKHLERNPRDFDIWVQLGHCLKELSDSDAADRAYTTANSIRQGDADLALNRGHLAKLRGNMEAAREFYQNSFDINNNDFAKQELEELKSTE
jgi:O-antigen biosynthesis protein